MGSTSAAELGLGWAVTQTNSRSSSTSVVAWRSRFWKAAWTKGTNRLVQMLDSQLEAMSGEANSELWTENAMHTSVEWERVRHLASELIAAMGWSASPPPFERGATYVGSDA